ncbi:MAG: hydrogenase 4 subunit F [Methanomassiliicoccales archaeon]
MLQTLLVIPAVTALACFLLRSPRKVEWASTAGASILAVYSGFLAWMVFERGSLYSEMLYLDSFGAFVLIITAIMILASSLYSIAYLRHEINGGKVAEGRLRYYYSLLHVFIFTLILVCISDNLGLLWIAIEATTLASAFLVGFYNTEGSLEAAWKYIMVCSVGIALALLGTILLYAASVQRLGESTGSLNWSTIFSMADQLDPTLVKLSFIFVLIGYGTKVGLAPMHTWLPDAYSQAPIPTAILSGALSNCALYAILRFHMVTSEVIDPSFSGSLLMIFGLLSLAVASVFIILVRDYRRLLAYSSVEHMGIIALAFGFGGTLGIMGGLLHMLNHSLIKSTLFLGAGQVYLRVKTKLIEEVKGLSGLMPYTSVIWATAFLAIIGCPPFGIFISELTILYAGFQVGEFLPIAFYLFFLAIIFAAVLHHLSGMVMGAPCDSGCKGESGRASLALMIILLAAALLLGTYMPSQLNDILMDIARLFPGGNV